MNLKTFINFCFRFGEHEPRKLNYPLTVYFGIRLDASGSFIEGNP
jgi:hypothetical protein